ncbi:MAG: hypothetical protein GWM87_04750, partial [Xanthomonadales bacterium]|nr:hypothetical protein [Xanthomonadales bacterium]NIX12317.1 hypothetical protein [Xanthomonadales bacterium]
MHWKLKASIQNLVGALPPRASRAAYQFLQRRFGRLQEFDPFPWLAAARETCELIREQGRSPEGRTFLEIGTGWVPLMPMAYWLQGAKRTISIDLNPYLKDTLIDECLRNMAGREAEVRETLGNSLREERLAALLALVTDGQVTRQAFLALCRIDYRSGVDAARTGLANGSVDFHCSHTVLEHIAPDLISGVLEEGNRIVRSEGLFVHRVDYTDHFSHTDAGISAINFLRFSEEEWSRYADNRFMYMNRLRHDDMLERFAAAGHQVLSVETHVDRELQSVIEQGG